MVGAFGTQGHGEILHCFLWYSQDSVLWEAGVIKCGSSHYKGIYTAWEGLSRT